MSFRLGDILIKRGQLKPEQLHAAIRYQKEHGGKLANILVDLNFVNDEAIAKILSQLYDVPYVALNEIEVDPEVVRLIPIETAIRYQVLPLHRAGTVLTTAVSDPTNVTVLDEIKFRTGYHVEPVVATQSAIKESIEKYYGTEQTIALKKVYDELTAEGEYEINLAPEETEMDIAELQKSSSEAPIIRLVNLILADAIRKGASDIHLEPFEREMRVRYRIDGVLFPVMTPPNKFRDALTSRVKIMSNLDISERRIPQDGRIKIRINDNGKRKEIDFRVSTLPTLFGEKIVLRILDKAKLPLDLTLLGFEPQSLAKFEWAVKQPYGMILVTGPTGSGKTSSLYTVLNKLNTDEVNIMTAEDPVEYNFHGINQVQTKEQIGLTFAACLRAFLRQDPNIIMVGEIRDLETAEIAVKAALTGHLVLSTLHTNDAPSSIDRLLNMGIEPFLVTTSINLICAQRLVRRICKECKQEVDTPPEALVELGFPASMVKGMAIYQGAGCPKCNDSGYKGRIGLFEVMEMSPAIQNLVLTGGRGAVIRDKAREEGMITLRESGLEKIRAGMTTIEEVLRETTLY
ncbi:MAG: type IV-A pilus assembly ATPase PilB [Acidobacteriota bacterium]